jgi:hypothetical protein
MDTAVIKQQAALIAREVERRRVSKGIQSDLVGADLIDAIALSIKRLKIFYWFSYFIFADLVTVRDEDLPSDRVLWAKLTKPGPKLLKDLESIYNTFSEEDKKEIESRKDRLTEILRATKDASKKYEDLLKGIEVGEIEDEAKPDKNIKVDKEDKEEKKSEEELNKEWSAQKRQIEAERASKNESVKALLYKYLLKEGKDEGGDTSVVHNTSFEGFGPDYPAKLLNGIIYKYMNAKKADLPHIDMDIYGYLIHPGGIRKRLAQNKLKALGYRKRLNPATGKREMMKVADVPSVSLTTDTQKDEDDDNHSDYTHFIQQEPDVVSDPDIQNSFRAS